MVFGKLREGLSRTRNRIAHALRRLGGDTSTAQSLEALEEILYTADVGPLAGELLADAEKQLRGGRLAGPKELPEYLRGRLSGLVQGPEGDPLPLRPKGPTVVLIAGVNGSGKTTSVAKLAAWLQRRGNRVLVAAGDTFRAAAVEQLRIWCGRVGVDLVAGAPGADPAAVAHDAAEAALRHAVDVLLVDTAGRLHTQSNLMAELNKIGRVLGRKIEGAPHETLLVLDATTGQNAIQQARRFTQAVPVTGLILAKLDGTAKGGAVLGIGSELKLPVKFVGLGEQLEDLEVFHPGEFVDALLAAPQPA
ncbi:MAG: signal recognition particle-docking protein FtsY [Planctomycetota bacterium]|nr:MAG: signal recognition particle-docking protein FtsY [Planctomycetota bacterium]